MASSSSDSVDSEFLRRSLNLMKKCKELSNSSDCSSESSSDESQDLGIAYYQCNQELNDSNKELSDSESSSEETPTQPMYHVIEVYYKHGGYSIERFESEEELVNYIEKKLEEDEYNNWDGASYSLEDLDTLPLEDLITEAIKHGDEIISSQAGYGIISVIKGEPIGK